MEPQRIWAAAGLLLLLTSACDSGATEPAASAGDTTERVERVERMVDDEPAELLARVRAAYGGTVMRVSVTRGTESPYTFVAGRDAWRVDLPAAPEVGGDGRATVLAAGDEVCFDQEARPMLSVAVAPSYGVVDFDREPWACAASGFGLTPLVTFALRREDPRWRIENLTPDDPGPSTAEVERVDGEALLHLRTTGVTDDGPLDPARPVYDLWVDGDHLPVRMTSAGLTWDFDYPDDLGDELRAPAADRRGSYGFALGPGQGVAKACFQSGQCPEPAEPVLTWGDGRR